MRPPLHRPAGPPGRLPLRILAWRGQEPADSSRLRDRRDAFSPRPAPWASHLHGVPGRTLLRAMSVARRPSISSSFIHHRQAGLPRRDWPGGVFGRKAGVRDEFQDDGAPGRPPVPGAEPVPGIRLVRRVGVGGSGEVWKAEGAGGFPIAVKIVPLSGTRSAAHLRGLDIARTVRHPNLLANFGAWVDDERLILAMELADGSLWDRFLEARDRGFRGIPRDELVDALAEAARGVDYLNDPRHMLGGRGGPGRPAPRPQAAEYPGHRERREGRRLRRGAVDGGRSRQPHRPPVDPRLRRAPSSSSARPRGTRTSTAWPSPTATSAPAGCRSPAT